MKNAMKRFFMSALLIACVTGGTAYAKDGARGLMRSSSSVYGKNSQLDITCYDDMGGAEMYNKSGSMRYLWVEAKLYDESGEGVGFKSTSGKKVNGAPVSVMLTGRKNVVKTEATGKLYKGTTSDSGVSETLRGSQDV